MPADLERLRALVREDGARIDRSGKGLCPLHEDSEPSLSTFAGRDGRGLWKCHAGCGHGDAVEWLKRVRGHTVREALDIIDPDRDAGKPRPRPTRSRQRKPRPAKPAAGKAGKSQPATEPATASASDPGPPDETYEWVGPGDYRTKQFRWHAGHVCPDGARLPAKRIRWKRGTRKADIVHVARRKGGDLLPDTLVFCEGAKAAQSLADRGIAACGIVDGGAPTSLKGLRWLRTRTVSRPRWVLWPDNDEPGQSGMRTLAERAREAGVAHVAIVPAAEGEPAKADAADWTGDPLERIRAAIPFDTADPAPSPSPNPANAGDEPDADPDPDPEWERNSNGAIKRDSSHNVEVFLALENIRLRWDTFLGRPYLRQPQSDTGGKWVPMTDLHYREWYLLLDQRHKYRPSPMQTWQWDITGIAARRKFHVVVEYLDSCPRPKSIGDAETIIRWAAVSGLGIDLSDDLSVACFRLTVAAAVRRVRQPGCAWKYVPILIGKQDQRKSSALEAMSPDHDWFLNRLDLDEKDKVAGENLKGKWIVELKELAGMRSTTAERIKAFVEARFDRYRVPYAIHSEDHARQCVFFGSTNQDAFLADSTGNVRFWPIRIGSGGCHPDWFRKHRDVLWGAASLIEPGLKLWPDDETMRAALAERQEAAYVQHPWEDWIREQGRSLAGMTSTEILEKLGESKHRGSEMALAGILQRCGFEKIRKLVTDTAGRAVRKRVWVTTADYVDAADSDAAEEERRTEGEPF